jgi:hypothetical protein
VQATVLEAKRGDGNTVMVKWELENKTGEKKQMTGQRTGWYDPYRLTGGAYFLDLGNRTKYPVAQAAIPRSSRSSTESTARSRGPARRSSSIIAFRRAIAGA